MAITKQPVYGSVGPVACCAACEFWTGPRSRGYLDTDLLADSAAEGKCINGQGTKTASGGCGGGELWIALSKDPRVPQSGIAPAYSPYAREANLPTFAAGGGGGPAGVTTGGDEGTLFITILSYLLGFALVADTVGVIAAVCDGTADFAAFRGLVVIALLFAISAYASMPLKRKKT